MVHQVAGHRSRLLDIDSERQKLEQEAKKLTKEVLQDWANIQEDDIKVRHLGQGPKNPHKIVYHCIYFSVCGI